MMYIHSHMLSMSYTRMACMCETVWVAMVMDMMCSTVCYTGSKWAHMLGISWNYNAGSLMLGRGCTRVAMIGCRWWAHRLIRIGCCTCSSH